MRAKSLLLTLALIASAVGFSAAPSQASTVRSIAAPWVNTYAAPLGTKVVNTIPKPQGAKIEKRSVINIEFNTIPFPYQAAIQASVDAWSQNFTSAVPINVNATWDRMNSSSVLASATPVKYFNNFPGAPDKELWYASALANSVAGKDLDPKNPEISISINSTVAPTFYLGTDGNCPSNKYDLQSILLHELGHGLGFLSNSEYLTFGYGNIAKPTPYDAYAQLSDGRRLMDLPTPSLELGQALTHTLVWSGSNGIAANNGIKPKLYTPLIYEAGSSVSHLDLETFGRSGENSVMAPNLAAGQIFHTPGALLLAMLNDMLQKPPAGIASGIPQAPRNVRALVGDRSAIVAFDPPANARTSQVSSYIVKVNQTGAEQVATSSPVTITGLNNGSAYSFTVKAKNVLGISEGATTNGILPQASWKSSVIDAAATSKYLATTTFNKNPAVVYTDSKNGDLKLATWNGKMWNKVVVDGNAKTGGKTADDVSGYLSVCTSRIGKNDMLHIFYSDLTEKDLRYAAFDGKKWSYSIVDGNGPKIQPYQEKIRTRTGSDVSVGNACAVTDSGVQVFYRDESQGILLGAVKDGTKWRYELIDGDRSTDGRTTGDVAFHIKAVATNKHVYLAYDSILSVNQDKQPLRGEMRVAERDTAYPEDWSYSTIDTSGNGVTIAGFDVSMELTPKSAIVGWFTSSGISAPDADQVRWMELSTPANRQSIPTSYYGIPNGPMAQDKSGVIFGCQKRLCVLNKADQTISLISSEDFSDQHRVEWISLGSARYVITGVSGKLTLFKAIK